MVSRVGMIRWNLRGLFLAWMCPWRLIPTDCHMQVTSPSCCLPEVHVDRTLRCARLQIWLSHILVRFYSRSWNVAITAIHRNRSGCRPKAVRWRIIFLRSSRVLLAHVGRALGLMRIINMCRLVPACGTMTANLRDYGMQHCWKTLHPLRIEMCGPVWLHRSWQALWNWNDHMQGHSIDPHVDYAETCPCPLGVEVCWRWVPKRVDSRPGCCFRKMVTLWWWQARFKLSLSNET